MMEIRVRQAGLEDVDVLVHHRRAMFEEMGFREAAELDRVDQVSRQYFEKALAAGEYKGWLAEDADGTVMGGGGIVIADWPGFPGETQAKRAWILNMYTEPETRRKGLARRLMREMVKWCKENGFQTVSLHASAAGRPLYENMGFQQTNEMRLKL